MDEAHKELARSLRLKLHCICNPIMDNKCAPCQAALALEVLAGEVERLKETITTAVQFNEGLAAERDRLAGEVDGLKDKYKILNAAAVQISAERDRLKAALEDAVRWMNGCAVSGDYPAWHAKARKALGDAS
jgi:hypothetical protein